METEIKKILNIKRAQSLQEEQISLYQDKIKAINERLDISEQKLIEFASMPDIEEQGRKLLSCGQVKNLVKELTWILIGSFFQAANQELG